MTCHYVSCWRLKFVGRTTVSFDVVVGSAGRLAWVISGFGLSLGKHPPRTYYGKGFAAVPPSGRGRFLEFLSVFAVFGRFPGAPGRLSYPPDPILGSAFSSMTKCLAIAVNASTSGGVVPLYFRASRATGGPDNGTTGVCEINSYRSPLNS